MFSKAGKLVLFGGGSKVNNALSQEDRSGPKQGPSTKRVLKVNLPEQVLPAPFY